MATKDVRPTYIRDLYAKGIKLAQKGRSKRIYATQNGRTIGITYANELPDRPRRWFLGLLDHGYDFVVFLCVSLTGEIRDYVIPDIF